MAHMGLMLAVYMYMLTFAYMPYLHNVSCTGAPSTYVVCYVMN